MNRNEIIQEFANRDFAHKPLDDRLLQITSRVAGTPGKPLGAPPPNPNPLEKNMTSIISIICWGAGSLLIAYDMHLAKTKIYNGGPVLSLDIPKL